MAHNHNIAGDFVIRDVRSGDSDDQTFRIVDTASTTATIAATYNVFTPANININVGTTLTWTISGIHWVRSGVYGASDAGDEFDPGLAQNTSVTHTFNAAGSFPYHCSIHPSTMNGIITVASPGGVYRDPVEGELPVFTQIPGAPTIRDRNTAYTPSMGGDPSKQGD